MICPICNESNFITRDEIKCGNFDQSVLYDTVKLVSCVSCGHVQNKLTEKEKSLLSNYYLDEYAKCHGLFDIVIPEQPTNKLVIEQSNLSTYLYTLTHFNTYNKFPFSNKFSEICLEQFIEHVIEPDTMFKQLSGMMNENGILKISCPNAMYYVHYPFPNYYFLIREHIHHFIPKHLKELALRFGFELCGWNENDIQIIKGVYMSNTEMTFKYTGKCIKQISEIFLHTDIKKDVYIENSFDSCYGIGREYLYLHANNLIPQTVNMLIDTTPIKHKYSIGGLKIVPEADLNNRKVFISAFAHKENIMIKLKNSYPLSQLL